MGTTAGTNNAQTPNPGFIFLGASNFEATTASTGVSAVNEAKGINSLQVAASNTAKLIANLAAILRQPTQPPEQLYFQAGKNVDATAPGIPPIGPIGGKPPIYSPLTGPQPQGLAILGATAFYIVAGANLTSGSLGIAKTVWPRDNTAALPTVTDIIAPGTLILPFRANIYATAYLSTDQAMLSLANTQVQVEIDVVTPAVSVFHFYGVQLSVNYNY